MNLTHLSMKSLAIAGLAVLVGACGTSRDTEQEDQTGYDQQSGHVRDVTFLAWSDNAQALLSFAASDGTIRLWDTESGRVLASASFSPGTGFVQGASGRLIATIHPTGDLIVRERDSEWSWRIPSEGSVTSAVSSNGTWIAQAERRGQPVISIYEASTHRLVRRLQGHPGIVNDLKFTADGKYVVSANGDGTVIVWAAETGRVRSVMRGHDDAVNAVAVSSDGRFLASAGADLTVRFWNLTSARLERILPEQTRQVRAVAFVSATEVVSGSDERNLKLWSVPEGKLLSTVEIPGVRGSPQMSTCCGSDPIMLEPSPSGEVIAVGCDDGYAYFWDRRRGGLKEVSKESRGFLPRHAIRFRDDSSWVWMVGSDDASVSVLSNNGIVIHDLGASVASVRGITAVALDLPANVVALGRVGGGVEIWDLALTNRLRSFITSHSVNSVALSPEGSLVAAGGEDQTIQVWSLKTGERLWIVQPPRP